MKALSVFFEKRQLALLDLSCTFSFTHLQANRINDPGAATLLTYVQANERIFFVELVGLASQLKEGNNITEEILEEMDNELTRNNIPASRAEKSKKAEVTNEPDMQIHNALEWILWSGQATVIDLSANPNEASAIFALLGKMHTPVFPVCVA